MRSDDQAAGSPQRRPVHEATILVGAALALSTALLLVRLLGAV